MGSVNETVMQFIERELAKNPDVKNATLFAGACEIDATIGDLNPRQFHAKYPLQVKRRMAPAAVATRRPARRRAPRRKAAAAPAAHGLAPAAGEDVMAFIARALSENPGVKNADLFAAASEMDPSIADLNPRQFHAKYPLQVKRRLAMAEAEARAAAEPEAPVAVEEAPAPAPEPAPEPEPEPVAEAAPVAEAPSVGDGDAAAVRGLLIDLARELANAQSQADTIDIMARLDEYVADIMKAARS